LIFIAPPELGAARVWPDELVERAASLDRFNGTPHGVFRRL
jgi:hypothetical protein